MKTQKKSIIAVITLIVIIALMAGIYMIAKPKPVQGSKTVSIEVISSDASSKTYTVSTDAEYLRQAMEEAEGLSFSGDESEYGLMVIEVNGERADYMVDGAYWAFYINDSYCEYGIDAQPVADGDAFSIVYTAA